MQLLVTAIHIAHVMKDSKISTTENPTEIQHASSAHNLALIYTVNSFIVLVITIDCL